MRHLSYKTEKANLHYIRDFILFHDKRHPSEMGAGEIGEYLTHLAVDQRVAASTQDVAFNSILFLFTQVLGLDLPQIEDARTTQIYTHVIRSRFSVRSPLD